MLAAEKPYQSTLHATVSSLSNVSNPHLHLMLSDRMSDDVERTPEQTFRRYNAANPKLGGCKKDSGGKHPFAMGEALSEQCRKCAEFQSDALAKYGHTSRVDHRTLNKQGVNRKPERYLGPARIREMSEEDEAQYIGSRPQPSSGDHLSGLKHLKRVM